MLARYHDDLRGYKTVRPEVAEMLSNKAAKEIREACRINDIEKEMKKQKITRMLVKAKGIYL